MSENPAEYNFLAIKWNVTKYKLLKLIGMLDTSNVDELVELYSRS